MERTGRLPDDQAEVVFSDRFVEQLADLDSDGQREDVLAQIVRLCAAPGGTHTLSGDLGGWNTMYVLSKNNRVVYKATREPETGTGLIEVLCLGPKGDKNLYAIAAALADSNLLDPDDVTDLWDALALVDVVAEKAGLDGWDYKPPPAPIGMQKAAVAAKVLDAKTAALLSKPEIEAALEAHYSDDSDPDRALVAALERARSNVTFTNPAAVVRQRGSDRCLAPMPRANSLCMRVKGHPGAHRR